MCRRFLKLSQQLPLDLNTETSEIRAIRHPTRLRVWVVLTCIAALWSLPLWLVTHCTLNSSWVDRMHSAMDSTGVLAGYPGSDELATFPRVYRRGSGSFFGLPESDDVLYKVVAVGPVRAPMWVSPFDVRVVRRWLVWTLVVAALVSVGSMLGARSGRKCYRGFAPALWQRREEDIRYRCARLVSVACPVLGLASWWIGTRRGYSPFDVLGTGVWLDVDRLSHQSGDPVYAAIQPWIDAVSNVLQQSPSESFVPTSSSLGLCLILAAIASYMGTKWSVRRLARELHASGHCSQRMCPSCGYPMGGMSDCPECGLPWKPHVPKRRATRAHTIVRLGVLLTVGVAGCVHASMFPIDATLVPQGLWRWAVFQPSPWNLECMARRTRFPVVTVPPGSGLELEASSGTLRIAANHSPEDANRLAYAWEWIPVERRESPHKVHAVLYGRIKYIPTRGGLMSMLQYPVLMGGAGLNVEGRGPGQFEVRGTVLRSRTVTLDTPMQGWRTLSQAIEAELTRGDAEGN